jgi:hypothetical protein
MCMLNHFIRLEFNNFVQDSYKFKLIDSLGSLKEMTIKSLAANPSHNIFSTNVATKELPFPHLWRMIL